MILSNRNLKFGIGLDVLVTTVSTIWFVGNKWKSKNINLNLFVSEWRDKLV